MSKKRIIPQHMIKRETKWRVVHESSVSKPYYSIRKMVYLKDGSKTPVRYPAKDKDYVKVKYNKKDTDAFAAKLNWKRDEEERLKKEWKIRTAFLKPEEVRNEFYDYVYDKNGHEKYARDTVSRFKRHVHDYFINNKAYDYLDWHKPKNQKAIIDDLKRKGLSIKTMKAVKDAVNLFFQFLHFKSDGDIPKLVFSFATLENVSTRKHEKNRREKNAKSDRRLNGEDYITSAQFKKIMEVAKLDLPNVKPSEQPKNFIPCFLLSYYYGMRRSETLGVIEVDDLKKGHIHVTKQRFRKGSVRELKWGWSERQVPHYYTNGMLSKTKMKNNGMKEYTLNDVYMWIQNSPDANPNQITKAWSHLMDYMDLGFTIHNLRNTYISNLFRDMKYLDISVAEISLCVGHKSVRTTEKYLRDFRSFSDEIFRPDEGLFLVDEAS